MEGLHDTYHAALQHGHVVPDDDDYVVGVVREPMYGIQTHLDTNITALAPPRDLLTEFKELADEIGHNDAIDACDFEQRYRAHLGGDTQRRAMRDILSMLPETAVYLVCYENTDDKICHRTYLKDELEQLADAIA
ncbi:DUF488 family protein [Halorubrum sp. AJ67]|uniref:DUF488 family protein, N3 subclade n=1 Tax=Halorubrum sp. AJ67 TaxID=1173487 RepID=UPI0003DB6AFA|nr:DUF488 family protein [Halorubrum sp. AJ67]CDK38179.1 uncharacterized protein BN903_379 [Halorubrum sp. AJ67]